MKRLAWLGVCGALIFTPAWAATPPVEDFSALKSLQSMIRARSTLDYEISYVLIRPQGIESMRYQQGMLPDGEWVARLMTLNGPPREVIQRQHKVSYFEPNLTPFTIESDRMVGALPPLKYLSESDLLSQYDVLPMGRAREAGVICQVVRMTPKHADRYGYVLWVDSENHLLMRADLLDQEGKVIEQYLALSFDVGASPTLKNTITSAELPDVLTPPQPKAQLTWQLGYIPQGFTPMVQSRHRLMTLNRSVETKMYSDGVFSFSVYLSPIKQNVPQQWGKQGRRTIVTTQKGQQEVVVIGDIPVSTAKRIAESVKLMSVVTPS